MSATVKEDKRYFFFINDPYYLYLEPEASDAPLISIVCSKLISFKRINLFKLITMKKNTKLFPAFYNLYYNPKHLCDFN